MRCNLYTFKLYVDEDKGALFQSILIGCDKINVPYDWGFDIDITGEYLCAVFSFDEGKYAEFKYIIGNVLFEAIIEAEKFYFLDEKIEFKMVDPKNRIALIKALTFFDKLTDKEDFDKAFSEVKDEVFVSSLLKFKLGGMFKRWEEIAKIANENSLYFLSSDTFTELLKFLIESLDPVEKCVRVVFNKSGYEIYNSSSEKVESEEESDDIFLITKLISLSPEKIEVVNSNLNPDMAGMLMSLFERRVEVKR